MDRPRHRHSKKSVSLRKTNYGIVLGGASNPNLEPERVRNRSKQDVTP